MNFVCLSIWWWPHHRKFVTNFHMLPVILPLGGWSTYSSNDFISITDHADCLMLVFLHNSGILRQNFNSASGVNDDIVSGRQTIPYNIGHAASRSEKCFQVIPIWIREIGIDLKSANNDSEFPSINVHSQPVNRNYYTPSKAQKAAPLTILISWRIHPTTVSLTIQM